MHVLDDHQRIAMIEHDTISGDVRVRYQLDNHLGSCSPEVDGSAAALIVSYEEYHPFGTTSLWLGANDVEVMQRRYRYTGKEKDEETGLYYHGARYYAPWLGRWTAADPISVADGTNVFAYVHNNPVKLVDPSGRNGKKPKKNPNQLRFEQAPPYRAKVKATKSGDGISQRLRDRLQAAAEAWGNPDPIDSGHKDKPAYSQKSGEVSEVWAEDRHDNRSRGATTEKKGATEARKKGEPTRTKRADPDGPKVKRGQPKLPPGLEDPRIVQRAEEIKQARNAARDKAIKDAALKEAREKAERDLAEKAAREARDRAKKELLERTAREAAEKGLLKKAGKVIPFVGIGFGLWSIGESLAEGDYIGAGLDVIGFVPVVGDAVDALRLGYNLYELLTVPPSPPPTVPAPAPAPGVFAPTPPPPPPKPTPAAPMRTPSPVVVPPAAPPPPPVPKPEWDPRSVPCA